MIMSEDAAAPAESHEAAPLAASRQQSTSYQPLDGSGRLLKERPDDNRVKWSRVAVGPQAAVDLFNRFTERERELLRALAEQRYLTVEQIRRRFYNSYTRTSEVIGALFAGRFIARFERTPYWMGRALGLANHPPSVYFIDWNGYYVLQNELPSGARRGRGGRFGKWRPESIGIPNSLSGHLLGTNELWSLLYSASRGTFVERVAGSTLALAWKGEEAARVSFGPKRTQEVAPDAEIVLRVGPPPAAAALERKAETWELADLGRQEVANADGARYRTLLLEFESGAHRDAAVIEKIGGYNSLMARGQVWQERYGGVFPRLLIVTREAGQTARMARLWREHYRYKLQPGQRSCPLLLTSLEQLRRAEASADGLLGLCWQHVLDPEAGSAGGRSLSLGEALGAPELAPVAR